jgi:hypothetical protein
MAAFSHCVPLAAAAVGRSLTGFQKEGRAAFEIAGRVRQRVCPPTRLRAPPQMAGEALANMKTVVSNSAQDHIIKRFNDM